MSKKGCEVYQLDGKGNAVEIPMAQVESNSALLWVRLDVDNVKSFIKKHLPHTPAFVIDLLSAKETRPRTLTYNDTLLATFRGVNSSKESVPEDMVSVRLWIQKNMIITVQRRKLATTREMVDNLLKGIGPNNIVDFLEALLSTLTDKTVDAIANLDDVLDGIEDKLIGNVSKIDRIELNNMRRRIVILRRYLVPQRDAISRIQVDKLTWLNETNLLRFREISDGCTRAVEDLNAEHERATIIHEELYTVVQENMNQKMYLLSIVAIIFMPLSFITGLLGINVGGIPGSSFQYAFLIVCVAMVGIFCCQWLYLKRKKWV